MHQSDMITAFDDCVERVLSGEPLERCLQDYPTLATVLRPMVEAALSVHRSAPPVPAGAKARVGARVMQQADRLGYVRSTRRWAWPRVTWAAAVLAMALFAGLLGLWLGREPKPQNAAAPSPSLVSVTPFTPTHTPSHTATLTQTPTFTASASATPTPTVTASPSPTPTVTASPSPTHTPSLTATPTTEPCTFVVTVASANLRSGPGVGYAVVASASQGERYPVLARHVSGAWYALSRAQAPTEVWAADVVGRLEGTCEGLPTSALPLLSEAGDGSGDASAPAGGADDAHDHSPPQLPSPSVGQTPGGGAPDNGNGGYEDDGEEHEDGEDENGDDHMPDR